MEFSGYYNSSKLLKEGNCYSFKYIKCVTLDDNNQYIILEDQFGIRHFIEYEPYKDYNLAIAGNIMCLVAKINCTGRLYLEPEHPVYKINKCYQFNIITVNEFPNEWEITVIDCFENKITLNTDSRISVIPQAGDSIMARVESIKKGIPNIVVDKELMHTQTLNC